MKITVEAKVNKKEDRIEKITQGYFIVSTKAPAKDNKANLDIIRQLAEYFKVSKSQVSLLLGKSIKTKVFEIK